MHLVYVDESGDPGMAVGSSRYFILCGLGVHHADWHEVRRQLEELRDRLARLHGLPPDAEIHAAEFLSRSRDHLSGPGGKALLRRYHRLWPAENDKGR